MDLAFVFCEYYMFSGFSVCFALGPWVDLLSVKYYFGGGLIGPWVDLLF